MLLIEDANAEGYTSRDLYHGYVSRSLLTRRSELSADKWKELERFTYQDETTEEP